MTMTDMELTTLKTCDIKKVFACQKIQRDCLTGAGGRLSSTPIFDSKPVKDERMEEERGIHNDTYEVFLEVFLKRCRCTGAI